MVRLVVTPGAVSDRRRELQRPEISRAAVRLFREHGVHATSGERIAEEVGLSGRTLWRWFRTEESCVEPVLARSIDAVVATLRRWPAGVGLDEHLLAEYRPPDAPQGAADADAAMAVIALSRTEPGLRAVWLAVHERAEPVLAEVIAERAGRGPEDLDVRVHAAAAVAAALRISGEDLAAELAAGLRCTDPVDRLGRALRAATTTLPRAGDPA